MAAADPSVYTPAVAAVALLAGAISGIYVAVTRRQTDRRTTEGDIFSRTVAGFGELIEAQDKRIDDLADELRECRRLHAAERRRSSTLTARLAALERKGPP